METERKWLIEEKHIPYDLGALEHHELEQAYVSFSPTIRVRSIDNEQFVLTVKAPPLQGTKHLSREEFETELNEKSYRKLLEKHEGTIIRKTRYCRRRPDGLSEEIDIFKGALKGLAYLEIEFETEAEALAFPSPVWVKKEVTFEKGYTNGALARHGLPESR